MRTGLRTEIILSISLLLAAALLFAGFLLVKLTESNLLEQQRLHSVSVLQLVAAGIDAPVQPSGAGQELTIALASLGRLQTVLGKQSNIVAWRLLDTKLQVITKTSYETTTPFAALSPSVLEIDGIYEELSYESRRFFKDSATQNYLDLSTPLWVGSQPYGLLQIRFSLDELQQRVQQSQRLILFAVIVYGLVLAAFGVYLLNRNIVRPVRQLHQATTAVAAGTLTSVKVPSGPGEIHDLADSFNQMIAALAGSRAETEEHIASLEETNQALEQARDDLVRSEKLATIGHLAAGMAHEIGNPLGAVIGYLNILKEDLTAEERDLVERSLAETSRIDRLVRELLDYSAPVDRQAEAFCPLTLMRETVEMLRRQGQLESVEIDDQCAIGSGQVSMDRDRLMQVWINLLLNAQDAMHGQGKVGLSSTQGEDFVSLTIHDDGDGIAATDLQRIFEPFFTTKAPGSGYGLGLAVCQRIVAESGGSIKVDSEAGRGTSFTVTLPCTTMEKP